MTPSHNDFLSWMVRELTLLYRHTKTSVEAKAKSFGIVDKNTVKELTELAVAVRARTIAGGGTYNRRGKFDRIVQLYGAQASLSHRTSQSVLLQQYSTPAPIGYLCGLFAGVDRPGVRLFEPSAGNGLLTLAARDLHRITANEIDQTRRAQLEFQGIHTTALDASLPFPASYRRSFEAVVTNPPFGSLDRPVEVAGYPIRALDHLMAIHALDTMKDTGRAAIIIGGHTEWDRLGRVQAGKNRVFLSYLHAFYRVLDVINLDGHKLYSRQGTSFDVRLILIDARRPERGPDSAAAPPPLHHPERDRTVFSFGELYERVMSHAGEEEKQQEVQSIEKQKPATAGKQKATDEQQNSASAMEAAIELELEAEALRLELELLPGLGAPYLPSSASCVVLDTVVPDAMARETHAAVFRIQQAVGGDVDEYVRQRLNYATKAELCKALSAEQIDAVAMAVYNVEERRQGMIVGDQTGIGKGRIAAAMVRYGVGQGLKPVFLTEKANLFSDLYRDLSAIGSAHLVPFIVNGREPKTDIKDEQGRVLYQAPPVAEQNAAFKELKVPEKYHFLMGTYSQFNSAEKKPLKPAFLRAVAEDSLLVMDEAHNSSGSSNTGALLQGVVRSTRGVVFLSATFAKRPDNLPVYALKTAISEANLSAEELVAAITAGGVALQEVLAGQLVAEGQMIRRERSFEGVEVNYVTLEEKEREHRAVADNITEILRGIIAFQSEHVTPEIKVLDKIAAAEGKEVTERGGTSAAGVDNAPYFSKVFQVINQLLFSVKAADVAERAIRRLKEGRKPVIAFSSTMGSFIEDMTGEDGSPVSHGARIRTDFAEVLQRGLDGILRYTETNPKGLKTMKRLRIDDFPPEAQAQYLALQQRIDTISSGISVSPIDVVVQRIQRAGYTVAEVTGRKYEVQLDEKTGTGLVLTRKKVNTNDAFRQFNENEVDVLLINQAGSTGASAHAIVTRKVPREEVRQRVMIVLQAELDINTEVQKRGRINRTGQIKTPVYDYVSSAIPAEKRLMMMLQKKLKSLDANTSSNQKNSSKLLDTEDFLNKYGDRVVAEYLEENPELNALLDDPLKLLDKEGEKKRGEGETENAAHRVSGRVAVLSTQMQAQFYREVSERYQDLVEYLKQTGDYDLEVEAMNLQAETINGQTVKVGKGGTSAFGDDSVLETVRANVLKKPFSKIELDNLLAAALEGRDPKERQRELQAEYGAFVSARLEEELQSIKEKYLRLRQGVGQEAKFRRIADPEEKLKGVNERLRELGEAEQLQLDKIRKGYDNRRGYLERLLSFFHVGRGLHFPKLGGEGAHHPAVFLGFQVDRRRSNPFAPSAVKLTFALASPLKYMALQASLSKELQAIIGASYYLRDSQQRDIVERWEALTKENSADRRIRHIVTGNLLQAFGDFRGKLVSYTTLSGETKKGILLPESWKAPETAAVAVPIGQALPVLRAMVPGTSLVTNNGMGLIRKHGSYRLVVPAARQRGGMFYLDPDLLALVRENNFHKLADRMVAEAPEERLEDLVRLLQDKFSSSVTLNAAQFAQIKDRLPKREDRVPVVLPPRPERKAAESEPRPAEKEQAEKERNEEKAREREEELELVLEAEALALELELLAF